MITDAILTVLSAVVGFLTSALPDGQPLTLPGASGLASAVGKVDSLVPIAGPMQALLGVMAAALVFVAVRLVLVIWNLLWP